MVFVIHWHESALDIHVFPIPMPPPTSLSARSLWVFPVHQVWALVSCIQPGLYSAIKKNSFESVLVRWMKLEPIIQSEISQKELMLLNCGVGKTLESPLNHKEIQPVHPKGDQSWVFIGRTDIEAETTILWPPDAKNWLIWKDPDSGKDAGQEEKGTIEDEMVGWHHRLNGPGFGWSLGVGDEQGGLACCSSWVHKELDTTEQLNWTNTVRESGATVSSCWIT